MTKELQTSGQGTLPLNTQSIPTGHPPFLLQEEWDEAWEGNRHGMFQTAELAIQKTSYRYQMLFKWATQMLMSQIKTLLCCDQMSSMETHHLGMMSLRPNTNSQFVATPTPISTGLLLRALYSWAVSCTERISCHQRELRLGLIRPLGSA